SACPFARPGVRTAAAGSVLVMLTVLHACAACASRIVSSPRPPTGLADGFGPEEPYGWLRSLRGTLSLPIHPGVRWVPGFLITRSRSGTRRCRRRAPAAGFSDAE